MPKNQLFKNVPDLQIVQSVLEAFGLDNIEDTRLFTKEHMIDVETVQKITTLIPTLQEYYLPCKGKIYLTDLNEKKCITILRQFLKIHNHTLISKEKYIKGKKLLFYQVIPQQIDMLTKNRNESEKVILSFD